MDNRSNAMPVSLKSEKATPDFAGAIFM